MSKYNLCETCDTDCAIAGLNKDEPTTQCGCYEMRTVKAVEIFRNINSSDYTDSEKILAIVIVLKMPTHNSIDKNTIINAFRWFLDSEVDE